MSSRLGRVPYPVIAHVAREPGEIHLLQLQRGALRQSRDLEQAIDELPQSFLLALHPLVCAPRVTPAAGRPPRADRSSA